MVIDQDLIVSLTCCANAYIRSNQGMVFDKIIDMAYPVYYYVIYDERPWEEWIGESSEFHVAKLLWLFLFYWGNIVPSQALSRDMSLSLWFERWGRNQGKKLIKIIRNHRDLLRIISYSTYSNIVNLLSNNNFS